MDVSALKLARLNNSVDSLYEFMHSQFNDIDSEDYKIISPQLTLLLQTVRNMYLTYKGFDSPHKPIIGVEELMGNYSALYELKEDIENFRLRKHQTKDLQRALSFASSFIDKI